MKVFIGSDDIASVLSGLAEGFRDIGHEVTTFVFSKHKFYSKTEYDILGPSPLEFLNFLSPGRLRVPVTKLNDFLVNQILRTKTEHWIESFDLFIFIWRSWIDEQELFDRIKKAGKKIICIHLGSDVRHISSFCQEFNEEPRSWESYYQAEDLNNKIRKIRIHESYADIIYSVPDQAGLYIRPYNHIYLPIPKHKEIEFFIPRRRTPRIIHAPSRAGIKGTSIIIETLDRLKSDGHDFTFDLFENIPNHELIKVLSNADILIDELLLHGPGVLAAEAMFAGCAVATKTLPSDQTVFHPPVLNITSTTIYDRLKMLLSDFDLRIQLAEKGSAYCSQYNNPANIATNMINTLISPGEPNDYNPKFYLTKYLLPKGLKLTVANKDLSSRLAIKFCSVDVQILQRAKSEGLI